MFFLLTVISELRIKENLPSYIGRLGRFSSGQEMRNLPGQVVRIS
jgi:hypothetical protein